MLKHSKNWMTSKYPLGASGFPGAKYVPGHQQTPCCLLCDKWKYITILYISCYKHWSLWWFGENILRDGSIIPLIARFIRPTRGPPGADRTQVGPILAPWTLLSAGLLQNFFIFNINLWVLTEFICNCILMCLIDDMLWWVLMMT